jgi:mono/diheme cytochrome c family protein
LDRGVELKKIFGIALFLLMLGVMSACSNDEPADEETTAPPTEQVDEEESAPAEEEAEEPAEEKAAATAGNEVFQKSCITCHSSGDITGGQAKLDGAKIHADFKSQDELLAFVSKNMPKNAPGSLSKEEYEAVVKYLFEQQ